MSALAVLVEFEEDDESALGTRVRVDVVEADYSVRRVFDVDINVCLGLPEDSLSDAGDNAPAVLFAANREMVYLHFYLDGEAVRDWVIALNLASGAYTIQELKPESVDDIGTGGSLATASDGGVYFVATAERPDETGTTYRTAYLIYRAPRGLPFSLAAEFAAGEFGPFIETHISRPSFGPQVLSVKDNVLRLMASIIVGEEGISRVANVDLGSGALTLAPLVPVLGLNSRVDFFGRFQLGLSLYKLDVDPGEVYDLDGNEIAPFPADVEPTFGDFNNRAEPSGPGTGYFYYLPDGIPG